MQVRSENLMLVLRQIPLLSDLADSILLEIAHGAQVLSLSKGKSIYAAGDHPRGLYHVMSGHLKVSVSSQEGGEKVLEILSPGDMFGFAELFGDSPCVSSVDSVTPVVLLSLTRESMLGALEHDLCLTRRLLSAMARRQSAIERDIAAECFQSGTCKLVDYLLRLAGPEFDTHGMTLELAIPKHVLAARLGFTPETLSRIFRELSDEGHLEVHGKHVTLTPVFFQTFSVRVSSRRGSQLPARCSSAQAPAAASRFDRSSVVAGGHPAYA